MRRVGRAESPEVLRVSEASPESSFRELDDAFLQSQTRIWLGEVLHIRFDEETPIADLLADGELLFQVSKTVWKMLLKKYVDLKYAKVYIHERTSFGKSEGKYMPYPKVDSFLKICQILGLTGIDMFSPSDVVEKRDIRRVCMCIRSLSKRARLKNLNVPDFDIVTYTIAMPTDMVGGICRNLEQSQCISSSSSGCSPCMDLREMYRQKSFGVQYFQHHDSHSESDEAESAFYEFEFQSPPSNASYEATNKINMVRQLSLKGYPVGEDISNLQPEFKLDSEDQTKDRHTSGHPGEILLSESVYHSHPGAIRTGDHEFRIAHRLKDGCSKPCPSSVKDPPFEELNGQHSVLAKESYISSTLWDESLRSYVSGFSASDMYINPEHSKEELIKESPDHAQIVFWSQEDRNNVRSECRPISEVSSNDTCTFIHEALDKEKRWEDTTGCSYMACESIASSTTKKIEGSSNDDAIYMHANNVINDSEIESFNSYMLSGRLVDGLVNAEIFSLARTNVSSEYPSTRKCDDIFNVHSDGTPSSYISPEVGSLDKIEGCKHANTRANNKFSIVIEEDVMNTMEKEAMNAKLYDMDRGEKASGLSTRKKHYSISEDGGSRRFISRIESTTVFDSEIPVSCSMHVTKELRTEDVGSSRPILLSSDKQQKPLGDLNHFQSDSDSNTVSKVGSGFRKEDLDLPSRSDIGIADRKNQYSTIRTTLETCGQNGSEYDMSPHTYSIAHDRAPEYARSQQVPDTVVADSKVVLGVNHEMDIDEQLSHSSTSMAHKDEGIIANSLLLEKNNKLLKNNSSDGSKLGTIKTQPVAGNCNSEVEEEVKVKFEQQDTSCERYEDLIVDVDENAEKICEEKWSNWYHVQENASCTNISKYDLEERKLSVSMGLTHMNKIEIHALKNEDMEVNFDLDIDYKHCVDVHATESKDIHVVHIEAPIQPIQACTSETVATRDPVDPDRVSTQFSDGSMLAEGHLTCSTATPIMEKEIITEVKDQTLPLGDDLGASMEHKEVGVTKNRKKTIESDEELRRIQNSTGKDRENATGEVRRSRNKVLRSVAGGMTLVGTLLIFLHLRRRREKENIRRTLGPRESQKPSQEDSTQRQVETKEPDGPHSLNRPPKSQKCSNDDSAERPAEIVKSSVLYPGERLKF